eukprot:CAMPEP_0198133676 /NCGR_PEP_ID=MMETSP1442-20131203/59687_1 /TAXON_ID= /ORGANISM="Craspedostauros australis, Strain CCMP3328" /LENGTH=228 /DNA_ID=CAMNT_0043794807 /DNA_START=498 /DNA_END=1184 /DNA_ORIENTATION=+
MFGSIFGKKKTESTVSKSSTVRAPATSPQATIVELNKSVETQEKREKLLEKKMKDCVETARQKKAKGDKTGAVFALKLKKTYEEEVKKIQNVKMTLMTQVINLEGAAQNADTYKALQQGSNTMKQIRTEVGIDKVDDVMDDIKEELVNAQEINTAMAQPVDTLMIDDEDLLAELDGLEGEDFEATMLKPPASAVAPLDLPSAPNASLPPLEQKEEDDLKKLEAELAGM